MHELSSGITTFSTFWKSDRLPDESGQVEIRISKRKRVFPHHVRHNRHEKRRRQLSPRASQPFSALFFAGEYLSRISTPAFPYTGLTGVELPGRDQLAGATGIAAVCILAALVAELVDRGADLRGIWATRKVKTMATGEPAGGRFRRYWCNRWRYRRDYPVWRERCAARDKQDEYCHT